MLLPETSYSLFSNARRPSRSPQTGAEYSRPVPRYLYFTRLAWVRCFSGRWARPLSWMAIWALGLLVSYRKAFCITPGIGIGIGIGIGWALLGLVCWRICIHDTNRESNVE
ncbi:hypothetical protein BJ170DRAFT_698542 [Xylariales sp. AK1849]|nr:hypothetical protein BJ170DRAFT_698542 [Xylariales sp. AK1849]